MNSEVMASSASTVAVSLCSDIFEDIVRNKFVIFGRHPVRHIKEKSVVNGFRFFMDS